jgi:hypothetical protein
LTLFISHCQCNPSLSPELCANPVMLERVMSFLSRESKFKIVYQVADDFST